VIFQGSRSEQKVFNHFTSIFVVVKLIAAILICYFCVLIVQPLYHMNMTVTKAGKCGADMCCKKMAHQTPAKPCGGAACNNDLCNPFVPCGISTASRVIQFMFANPVLELSAIKKPAVNDHIISNYFSGYWRPPRLS
jgi:hypothetical protein